jgi:hypothetical protein
MNKEFKVQVLNNLRVRVINELYLRCESQLIDGSFAAGHNGPYNDMETPVRNTAHMLYALCDAYKLTNDKEFYNAAEQALNYLLSNEYINCNGSYICRVSETKDASNGVIGHAWIIEALMKASSLFGGVAVSRARNLWKLHKFDYQLGIWAKPSVKGGSLNFDHTFNHQLWFAACIAPIESEEVQRQICCFIEKNVSVLQTYSDGIIYHRSNVGPILNWFRQDFKMGLRKLLGPIKNRGLKSRMYLHSVGYHAFNLYAFAMLAESNFKNNIDDSVDVKRLLMATDCEQYACNLLKVRDVGLRYNPSGIELAYAFKIFEGGRQNKSLERWLEFQLSETDSGDGLLVGGSPDFNTSYARIYQIMRLIPEFK